MNGEFHSKCEQIATALGGRFEPKGEIILPGGERIFLRIDRDRLCISGSWPCSQRGEVCYPLSGERTDYKSITIDWSRPAEAIAENIRRRFLPGFLPEWAKQTARVAAYDRHDSETKANLLRLAAICNVQVDPDRVGEFTMYSVEEATWTQVRTFGAHVNIELRSLSVEQAETVLKIVRRF